MFYFQGMFCEGMMHGQGSFTWTEEKTVYKGDFFRNQITGKGTYEWGNGRFVWKNRSQFSLLCIISRTTLLLFQLLRGRSFRGCSTRLWRLSSSVRRYLCWPLEPWKEMWRGTCHWNRYQKNNTQFDWFVCLLQGRLEYDASGKSFYEGEWRDGIPHGWGFRQYPSGNTYEGTWFDGIRHGQVGGNVSRAQKEYRLHTAAKSNINSKTGFSFLVNQFKIEVFLKCCFLEKCLFEHLSQGHSQKYNDNNSHNRKTTAASSSGKRCNLSSAESLILYLNSEQHSQIKRLLPCFTKITIDSKGLYSFPCCDAPKA